MQCNSSRSTGTKDYPLRISAAPYLSPLYFCLTIFIIVRRGLVILEENSDFFALLKQEMTLDMSPVKRLNSALQQNGEAKARLVGGTGWPSKEPAI